MATGLPEDDRRSGIADVGEVVDCRPADIHRHMIGFCRRERLFHSLHGVGQIQRQLTTSNTVMSLSPDSTGRSSGHWALESVNILSMVGSTPRTRHS